MSDEQIVPPSTARWKKIGTALLLAIAAACLTLFFFSPRLMLWNGFFLPEVDRAHDTLRQLANPFDLIPNHNSRVNQWRLLFPVLGNVAHLSDWQFLSLPFVGCIATLFYVVRICQRHELSTLESFFVVALAAMSPWYFVST